MRRLAALGTLVLGLAWLWPEYAAWRAEHALAEASSRLDAILHGRERGAAARESLDLALRRLDVADAGLPAEPRVALARGIGLILSGRAADAEQVLRAAIARGERAELSLNLGRALAAQGRDGEARVAFLRAAWAAPAVLDTLPRGLRAELLAEVATRESALRAGLPAALPPLPPEHRD